MAKNKLMGLTKLIVAILIILTVFGAAFFLLICDSPLKWDKIKSDDREWAQTMRFKNSGTFHLDSLEEDEAGKRLFFSATAHDGEELAEFVTTHNEFVASNPDYFRKDNGVEKIIAYACVDGFNYITFASNTDGYDGAYGLSAYDIDVPGIEEDGSFQYAYINSIDCLPECQNQRFDIPVLIFDLDYECQDYYTDTIIDTIRYFETDYILFDFYSYLNVSDALERISTEYPNVEIYYCINNGDVIKY